MVASGKEVLTSGISQKQLKLSQQSQKGTRVGKATVLAQKNKSLKFTSGSRQMVFFTHGVFLLLPIFCMPFQFSAFLFNLFPVPV